MSPSAKELLERVESWPLEDQGELAEYAREIEAPSTGIYQASPAELQVIDEAERGAMATAEEVEAAFRTFCRP
jgi:hypothetical protein